MIFQPSKKSPQASTMTDGLMSAIDKVKLNNTNIAYGTCVTAASTAAKVVKITGNENWDLFPGSIITVKFTYTNAASNPTLNVNDKGAMPIIYNTSNISTSNLAFAGSANRYITYVYTGSAFAFIGWSIDNNTTYSDATTSAAGLMSADDKAKLDGIEEGANKTIVDSTLSETSKNPVQNDVTTKALNDKSDKTHKHKVSDITDFPESLPASDVSEWAKAATKPTYSASEVGADAAGSAAKALEDAKAYTDSEISDIINGAPTTLDTLGEIADAMDENANVVDALDKAIGKKANTDDLTSHTNNTSNPHNVTKEQVGLGNVPNVATNDQTPTYSDAASLATLTSGEKLSIAFGKIKIAISNLISHISDKNNPHTVTKTQIGLGNVENKSSETIRSEITSGNIVDALGYTPVETDTTYDDATTTKSGLMSAADKAKLDETRLWRRCVVGQSTTATTNQYYKFASISLSDVNYDAAITFKVSLNYNDQSTHLGILTAHVRTSATAYWDRSELVWEYALSGIDTSKFILCHNTSTNPTIAELWVKVDRDWSHYHFDVLTEGTRKTSNSSLWTLYNKSSEGSEAALPSEYVQQPSTLGTIKNSISGNAATATNAAKVNNHTVNSDVPANAVFTDTWRDVQDNLTSTDTDKSLSANQGKVLKGYIDNINSQLLGLENLLKGI